MIAAGSRIISSQFFFHSFVIFIVSMKNMKGGEFIFWITSMIALLSCSHKINPERPSLATTDFKLDSLPNSEINIPVQVSLKPIYALAEKSVDTVFTSPDYPDGWIQDGCANRYKYTFRRGPLQMKASGTTFDLGFTGYYKITGSTRVCVNGTAISPWTPPCKCGFSEGERKVNVSFSNTFGIHPDYKVLLSVKRLEPQPLNKCEVCFWGQDITDQVMNGLKEELDAAKKNIENSYGIIDFRLRMQQLWDQMNKVYNVYELGWLQINPQKLRLNNWFARNDSLNIFLGLSARPVISFEKPVEKNSRIPGMGDFSSRPGFNIFLDAILHYDSLSNILNQQVQGKQLDIDKGPVKKTFIIKQCKLSGANNEKLIIRVDFGGSTDGVAYFIGKPVYNNISHIVEVKDLDFDVKTKDKLLRTAEWLFNKRIVNEISQYARFDLSSYIDTARFNLNKQLNQEWVKGITSYGTISDINLIGIYPLSHYLVIRSNCSGYLFVKAESVNLGF